MELKTILSLLEANNLYSQKWRVGSNYTCIRVQERYLIEFISSKLFNPDDYHKVITKASITLRITKTSGVPIELYNLKDDQEESLKKALTKVLNLEFEEKVARLNWERKDFEVALTTGAYFVKHERSKK